MPEKDPRHLLDKLAEIEDPRNEKGKRVCSAKVIVAYDS